MCQTASELKKNTYLFYTYGPTGNDIIIPVKALTRAEACDRFDRVYGEDTLVDCIVLKEEQYTG